MNRSTQERARIIERFQQTMAKKKVIEQMERHEAIKKKADEYIKKKELLERVKSLR